MLYVTEDVFVQNEFNEDSIQRQSILHNQQADEKNPNWINTLVRQNMLSDETQVLQVGYSEERIFYSYHPNLPEASAWN